MVIFFSFLNFEAIFIGTRISNHCTKRLLTNYVIVLSNISWILSQTYFDNVLQSWMNRGNPFPEEIGQWNRRWNNFFVIVHFLMFLTQHQRHLIVSKVQRNIWRNISLQDACTCLFYRMLVLLPKREEVTSTGGKRTTIWVALNLRQKHKKKHTIAQNKYITSSLHQRTFQWLEQNTSLYVRRLNDWFTYFTE